MGVNKIANYRLDEDLTLAFEALAAEAGLSATAQLNILMRDWVKEKANGRKGNKVALNDKQIERLSRKNIQKKFVVIK